MHSHTAYSLSTYPAWSEFLELNMIQEKDKAQEYQAHLPHGGQFKELPLHGHTVKRRLGSLPLDFSENSL